MDPEKRKVEQLRSRYEQLKKKVRDWEQAVYKTEGRKPNKDDMKSAPTEVQASYREFVKIRKYLEEYLSKPASKKNETVLTPGKIFFGGKHRRQLQRTDHTYLTRTPSKIIHKPKVPQRGLKAAPSPSLGLRSSSITASISENQATSGPSLFPFKKLFNNCKVKENGESAASKPLEQKKHNTILVKEDSNVVVERKVLVADRSIKYGQLPNKDGFCNIDFSENANQGDEILNEIPENSESDAPNKEIDVDQRSKINVGSSTPRKCTERVEKLLLKSPRIKGRTSFRTSKGLDSGWLARVDEAEADNEAENLSSSNQNSMTAEGLSESPGTQSEKPSCNNSYESLQSFGNEGEMGMEVDSESCAHAFGEATNSQSGITSALAHGPENSDSGICVNSFFNYEEVCKAIDEVMKETPPNNESVVSDADGSLLYSYSEDACLPSDQEQDEFSTVDTNTISTLIKSLSDSISNDDDASKSTYCSVNSSSHQENEDSDASRKRPASFAFSPSPEKLKEKRKFFKSSKGERRKPVYSMSSYKPPSPRKKVTKKPETNTPTARRTRSSMRVGTSVQSPAVKKLADDSFDLQPGVTNTGMVAETKKRSARVKKQVTYKELNDEKPAINPAPRPSESSKVVDIFDEVSQPTFTMRRKKGRRFNAKNQTLDSKISSGKLEDNYVRVDITKKVFVRGHRKISASKVKRLDWKHRKSMQGKEAVTKTFTCHKCGDKGHFAKFCTKDTVAAEEAPGEEDNSPFPSLEEAARMVYKNPSSSNRVNVYTSKTTEEINEDVGSETPMEVCGSGKDTHSMEQASVNTCPQLLEFVEPFFSGEDSMSSAENYPENEEDIMLEGIRAFGYDSFRSGQKEAILRVLKGLSTLLILSTGSGKSLCYQLPAYLYQKKYPGALTLCISPLVSLMEDQVQGIPPFLNAACLHGGMTTKQKEVVLEKVKTKKLHILLVSPEAVCGGLFGLLRGNTDNLPKISFACIDEVHCVSQWSHNFRPSYLQLCKILREKLNVKTILGLTATATETTAQSICEHLQIDPSTTIRGELIPKNLKLTVSRDVYKDEALLNLLRGERFRDCDSIIIYCTRREECERIATLIRTKMQEISTRKIIKTKSRARLSGNCEAYHAGMTPRRRKNVQNGFMSGDIRIVVATVAFGMGIDKSDIRAVIHYNMPSAFESYVQEIGRAGRDGLPAHCHLFLDNSRRNDLCELKRHVYANSVDRPTIRKLLRKVFQSCKCERIETLKGSTESSSKGSCPGHEVSFSMDNAVTDLDLPKENITTLLCYLELGKKKWIEILPLTYEICKIQSYGGAKLLKSAASRCAPLAVAIALQKEKNKFRETDSYLEFNVIEAAATVGWNSSVVKKELKNLEWTGSQYDEKGNPTRFRKSGLMVEFSGLAYRVKSPGSLSDDEADEVLNSLHVRNNSQEKTELYQLQRVYQALLSVSFPNVNNICDSYDEDKSEQLKKFIYDYFNESNETIQLGTDAINSLDTELEPGKDEELRRAIRQLIDSNRDINFTARSIARIFQGISSPCFPADVWYRSRDFWRRFLDVDFHLICRIAAQEL